MAWPNTPLTAYLAGGPPFIKAFDLNSFQSAINGIINATFSLKAAEIDGTGGAVVAPVAGTVKVSATASGAAVPMTAVTWGRVYKEAALFGAARVLNNGTVAGGYNVKTEPGGAHVLGQFIFTFNGAPTNLGRVVANATPTNAGAGFFAEVQPFVLSGADLQCEVRTYNAAGAAANVDFMVTVFGG